MDIRREYHFGRVIPCYAGRPANAFAMLDEPAQTAPDALAVVDGATRLTHEDLHLRAGRLAGGLAARGVRQGDRVALLVRNRWEFTALLIACLRAGFIAAPVSIRSEAPELAYILADCGAAALIHDGDLAHVLPPEGEGPAVTVNIDSPDFMALAGAEPAAAATLAEEDTAVILYTSGTTGRPKGAMLTHFNITHSCLHFSLGMKLTTEDRSLMAVPASHVTGLIANILTILSVGGALLNLPRFDVTDFLNLATAEGMTHTVMVPAMYNLTLMRANLGEWDLSRWRLGGFGGAPMPEPTIEKLAALLPGLALVNCYGSTETTSPATMLPPGRTDRFDSVGLPLPCAEISVMDEDGQEVAPGVAGELWIGGAMVVPGYWSNPEKTVAEFRAGYWKSGDVGSMDADGFVRVFDRVKDMINRGGYKIYSAEVENVLAAHPAVAEAAVIPSPDPVLGERVAAVIVLAEGAKEDETALKEWCASQLSDYKRPESYAFQRDPLPRNANGKIQKRALY